MRFLVDAQLPPKLARCLREAGHQAEHIFELLPEDASDSQVAEQANRRGAILLTKDEDFVALSIRGVLNVPLVWVRAGNMTTVRLWAKLEPQLRAIEAAVDTGERVIEVA